MSLCVLGLAHLLVIPAHEFSLAWTHSVERTRWQETWQMKSGTLQIIESRVKGSGAGMEPPDGAKLHDGWWIYRPAIPPQKKLVLAASGLTGRGWSLCTAGGCWTLGRSAGQPITLEACQVAPLQGQ
jgi:hypothetical protein